MNKKFIFGLISVAVVLLFWFFAKPPLEDLWSRFMDFVNPRHYSDIVREKWSNKSSSFLINKLNHPSIVYSGAATTILRARNNNTMDETDKIMHIIKNGRNYRGRYLALSILFFWDKQKAIDLSMEIIRSGRKHPLYEDALLHLAHIKYEPAFPYVIDLAKSPDKYNNGSIMLLEEFGKPEAIPILEEMLKDPNVLRIDKNAVRDAIKSIKEKNE
ncbi:MAG: HEAT repeat domain-containing protein [Candidatus Omnitrophica bacterium]|nr:HEAT repeat domain-containing protein [Candidatus Omnitrophota bacterium]